MVRLPRKDEFGEKNILSLEMALANYYSSWFVAKLGSGVVVNKGLSTMLSEGNLRQAYISEGRWGSPMSCFLVFEENAQTILA